MNLSKKVKILLSLLLILVISIPITLAFLQKQQNDRSNAAAATTLSLIPQPGPSNSITKNINDDIPIDIMVNPGTNIVTILRLQVQYDPTKLQAADTPYTFFTPNSAYPNPPLFRQSVAPSIKNIDEHTATISLSLSTGIDPSMAVRSLAPAGTFHFKAIGATGSTPTEVKFTSTTQAISAGSQESSNDNVLLLSSSTPSEITIIDTNGQPEGQGTNLSVTALLDGIGIAGDTPNPTGNDLSNKKPLHPDRTLHVFVYDTDNQLVSTGAATISYVNPGDTDDDKNVGTFMTLKGPVVLDKQLANGQYTIKVQSDRYLRKAFSTPISIDSSKVNTLTPITLVAGDTDGSNALDVADYNALLDCGYGALNPLPMSNQRSEYNSEACKRHEPRLNIDINDDGSVNAFDYNLFVRELSIQSGD